MNHSVEQIAIRLSISEPTLRKYYFRELQDGADLASAILNEKLWERAMSGNVSAMKALKADMDRRRAVGTAPIVKEPVIGKKAEREARAKATSGLFAVPPGPRLAINND